MEFGNLTSLWVGAFFEWGAGELNHSFVNTRSGRCLFMCVNFAIIKYPISHITCNLLHQTFLIGVLKL